MLLLSLAEQDTQNNDISSNNKNIERKQLEYGDLSDRFYTASFDFSKQYCHIYSARLNNFREILSESIAKKWSNKYSVLKLCELREKEKLCIIVGTLFKHQQLKPSILKEISDQLEILPQPIRTHFVHDEDTLVLEDELQRIRLSGSTIDVHQVVTGVVCAVLGSEDEDGIFFVREVIWAEPSLQKTLPRLADDRYLILMSGLNLASRNAENQLSLHLMLEWISGVCGSENYQYETSKIVRVIVAGGLFFNGASSSGKLQENDVVAASEEADSLCAAISSSVEIDLMPGCRDPVGIMLPQKPFHYCMLPKAIEYKSFKSVSNPYECDLGGMTCLGSSGEPIKDILRYSKIETALEAMLCTLKWRHLAPTAPDTLPCAPCINTDPLIMHNCPAIYFMGGNESFDTCLYEGKDGQKVRVVCIPDFCTSKSIVVVNLKNLECNTMSFL